LASCSSKRPAYRFPSRDLIVVSFGAALAGEPAWAVVVLPLILAAGFIGGTVQFAAPSDG
jgi:hypothetical protein